jgi:hypothetical protein
MDVRRYSRMVLLTERTYIDDPEVYLIGSIAFFCSDTWV